MIKSSPRLIGRGIILVFIPFLCQVIFVVILLTVLHTGIQKHQTALTESYDLIRKAYKCFRDTSDQLVLTALSVEIGISADPIKVRENIRKLQVQTTEFANEIEKDPNQKQNAEALKTDFDRLMVFLDNGVPRSRNIEWDLHSQKDVREPLSTATSAYLATLTKIVEIEERLHKADFTLANKSINDLFYVIAFAVSLPILVAILLAKYFSSSITTPIMHLRDNGIRLSQRSKLLPVISDAIEFVHVDQLLHTVSRELDNASEREQDVFTNAVDMICSLDSDEVFRASNPFVMRMLGYQPIEILGRHLSEFSIGSELLNAVDGLRRTRDSGSLTSFELKMLKKDNSTVFTKWSCVWSPAHQMFFCIVSDVSEQKRAEQLKLDFSDALSQDVSSPLVAMQSSLTALLAGERGEISSEVRSTLIKTSKNVDRLVLMANELLDFQKIKGGKMQVDPVMCDLTSIVEDAVDFVSILAEPKRIQLHLPKQRFQLQCDRSKVLQIVVNLLSNAIKFSPPESTIEITIMETHGSTELSVIDAGPGIPLDYQQRIFEPFEQVPSAQSKVGTGLGLAICKLIVEAHGGTISVSSLNEGVNSETFARKNQSGSVFTIKLPKQDGSAKQIG